MDTRVFWSVLCALLVFSGLCAFGAALLTAVQREAARQAQEQAQQQADDLARRVAAVGQAQAQQQAALQRWSYERRRLLPGQRCLGGVVVEVRGSTYTQLGTIAQPVHCSGAFADQPLR